MSKHMHEHKLFREKLDKDKRHGDQLRRWNDQIVNWPENIHTDGSEDFELDDADDDIVPLEQDEESLPYITRGGIGIL